MQGTVFSPSCLTCSVAKPEQPFPLMVLVDDGCLLSVAIFPCHGNMSPCACQSLTSMSCRAPFVRCSSDRSMAPHQSAPVHTSPTQDTDPEGDRMGAGPCLGCCPVVPYTKVSPPQHRGPRVIRYHHGQRFADQLWTSLHLT